MKEEVIAFTDPKSPVSEMFKTLRTNIQFMNTNKPLKTLLVTSTLPGEGKSWTVANLAVTFAQAGKNVLIIDADMRKGRQFGIFEVPPTPGLSNYLSGVIDGESGNYELERFIHKTELDNLFLMPAGNVPPNPTELLVSEKMINLIGMVNNKYDITIFDGTPGLLVADASIISRIVDSSIIVTAHNETKIDNVSEVKKAIENIGGKVAGVVINKIPVSAKKYENTYYYGHTAPAVIHDKKKQKLNLRKQFFKEEKEEQKKNKTKEQQESILEKIHNKFEKKEEPKQEDKQEEIVEPIIESSATEKPQEDIITEPVERIIMPEPEKVEPEQEYKQEVNEPQEQIIPEVQPEEEVQRSEENNEIKPQEQTISKEQEPEEEVKQEEAKHEIEPQVQTLYEEQPEEEVHHVEENNEIKPQEQTIPEVQQPGKHANQEEIRYEAEQNQNEEAYGYVEPKLSWETEIEAEAESAYEQIKREINTIGYEQKEEPKVENTPNQNTEYTLDKTQEILNEINKYLDEQKSNLNNGGNND